MPAPGGRGWSERKSFARALKLNIDGLVAEGPYFNIFVAKGGKLLTPRSDEVLGCFRPLANW